ncbi:fimbrial protein [Photorhabdus africana]|uniref:fimbrial protein n=1 Tax=Photorhabdus africana TaxID=3097554 RepID=UPI002B409724|nr:hypothetical protein [Photorhabdus sp. CRI-LC]
MKKILKISVVAALVLGAASAALAAGGTTTTDEGHVGKNTTVTITGNVVAATCDVTGSNAGADVDLGNANPAAFVAGTIGEQKGIASYVNKNPRPITIYLSNCDDKNIDEAKVQLRVTGPVLGGSENVIFNNSEDGKNVGAILTYKDKEAKETVVSNNRDVPVGAKGSTGTEFNGQSITFTAYMASIIPKPEANQHVRAPITFSYAYN